MENQPNNYDPELEESFAALDLIVKKYLRGPKKDGKKDALRYAEASLAFAKSHPGILETLEGEDATPIEIHDWENALENANKGNWEPMKDKIMELSISFDASDDKEESKAFLNLSKSIK